MITKLTATDKSVRDHPQSAQICASIIAIICKVGTKKAGQFSFPLSAWLNARCNPTFNEHFNRRELLEREYRRGCPGDFDNDPCQGSRIVDSQIRAIEAALKKRVAA